MSVNNNDNSIAFLLNQSGQNILLNTGSTEMNNISDSSEIADDISQRNKRKTPSKQSENAINENTDMIDEHITRLSKKSKINAKLLNGNKNSNSTMISHSNTSLHSQLKTKSIEQLKDMIKVTTLTDENESSKTFMHKPTGLNYELNNNSVPVFQLTKTELLDWDPIDLYEKTSDLGNKYGLIKLKIIDQNCSLEFTTTNNDKYYSILTCDQFCFETKKQLLCSKKVYNANVDNFYRKLFNFHKFIKVTDINILSKLPSINKKVIDFYQLYNIVNLRGGFDKVCSKKSWAQIGREMGYSGKVNNSLSTVLRSAFVRILLDFDRYEKNQGNDFITGTNSNNESNYDLRLTDYDHNLDKDTDMDADFNSSQLIDNLNFQLEGTNLNFTRMKDIKLLRGLGTNKPDVKNNISSGKKNISTNMLSGNPNLVPSFQNFFEEYDNATSNNQANLVYDLKQIYEKSQTTLDDINCLFEDIMPKDLIERNTSSIDEFQQLYHNVLIRQQSCIQVQSCTSQNSMAYGNRAWKRSNYGNDLDLLMDTWNLNNLPLNPNSLFKFLNFDMSSFTNTNYNAGMIFTNSGWSANDMFLPSLDFHHFGSSKIWYTIAPEDFHKFEQYLASCTEESSSETVNLNLNDESGYLSSSFFKCAELTYFDNEKSDNNSQNLSSSLRQYFNIHNDKNNDNTSKNIQFSIDGLQKHGINVYRVAQESGSYIFKYPKCYSTSIGSNFFFSQSAYFAPKSWLHYIEEGTRWSTDNKFLTGLHHELFLTNLYLFCKDEYIMNLIKPRITDILEKELDYRSNFTERFPEVRIVNNKFDYISDFSLQSTVFSKIVISDETGSINLSVPEFLDNIEVSGELREWTLFNKSIKKVSISMEVYYSDEILEIILNSHNTLNLIDILHEPNSNIPLEEEMSVYIREHHSNESIPLDALQAILERSADKNSEFADKIIDLINRTKLDIIDCRNLLSEISHNFTNSKPNLTDFEVNPLAELNVPLTSQCMENFQKMVTRLEKSQITFPESEYILKLSQICQMFQNRIDKVIHSTEIRKIHKLYLESFEIPVSSKYCEKIIRIVCRHKWLQLYYELFVSPEKSTAMITKSVKFLYDFLQYGLKYAYDEDKFKLQKVKDRIILCQETFKKVRKMIRNIKLGNKIIVGDIVNLLDLVEKEKLPISTSMLKIFQDIVNKVEQAKTTENPLWRRLSVNKPYIDEMYGLIKANKDEYLQLCYRFNGSERDRRLCIDEIEDITMLSQQLKDCRKWFLLLKRVMWKQNMSKILDRITRCLNVDEDCYTSKEDIVDNTDLTRSANQGNNGRSESYCICRKGDIGSMIQCDICEEWYHQSCIISDRVWNLPDGDNIVFICPICDIHQDTVITRSKFIIFSDLKQLLLDSLSLEVVPDRETMTMLFMIYEAVVTFHNHMKARLYLNGLVNDKISVAEMKHYVKKAEGAQIDFADLLGPVKRYYRTFDLQTTDDFVAHDRTIVTVRGTNK